jgi:hypothetical protein
LRSIVEHQDGVEAVVRNHLSHGERVESHSDLNKVEKGGGKHRSNAIDCEGVYGPNEITSRGISQ